MIPVRLFFMAKKSFNTPIILSILIGVVLVITIALATQTPTTSVPIAAPTPGAEPTLVVSETSVDLGTMKVSDERSKDITITNTGKGPLTLSRVRTSCDCTFADLTIGGQTLSFNMEMHNPITLRQWSGALAPGESATLKAIYRPSIMPVQGSIERIVSFDTNDPKKSTVEITLRAVVE